MVSHRIRALQLIESEPPPCPKEFPSLCIHLTHRAAHSRGDFASLHASNLRISELRCKTSIIINPSKASASSSLSKIALQATEPKRDFHIDAAIVPEQTNPTSLSGCPADTDNDVGTGTDDTWAGSPYFVNGLIVFRLGEQFYVLEIYGRLPTEFLSLYNKELAEGSSGIHLAEKRLGPWSAPLSRPPYYYEPTPLDKAFGELLTRMRASTEKLGDGAHQPKGAEKPRKFEQLGYEELELRYMELLCMGWKTFQVMHGMFRSFQNMREDSHPWRETLQKFCDGGSGFHDLYQSSLTELLESLLGDSEEEEIEGDDAAYRIEETDHQAFKAMGPSIAKGELDSNHSKARPRHVEGHV
ncbi:hypothetical protein M407DRAFT_23271 [Tulasnella calospora MUT 4182]|uniref:Uncharacterized protein n=1 Tax=Tulasnella calospora MUT 4182 TaxID=1051891 RepID=A0A0C3M190_9AGAM|nr:hypothetical protein M407DRAFT_23271 [Tulasnella calospora MUT 4182]